MAKAKKPKKKYTPRPVYYPTLIIALHAFNPIEKVLDNMLDGEEVMEDSVGNRIYINGDGSVESVEAGLDIYLEAVVRAAEQLKISYRPTVLLGLKEQLCRGDEFSETELLKARAELTNCKAVIAKTPPAMLREIALTIHRNLG